MKVCIVGGGLAGLASAISLSEALLSTSSGDDDDTVEITVVEKRDFSSRGATFGLALNGQAALQEICPPLLEELKEVGILMSTGGYMLPWYRVRDGLLERARQASHVKIVTNTALVAAEEQDDGVLVTLEETESDGTMIAKATLSVDLLVGADGVHSSVRKLVGAPPAVSSHTKCWRGALNDLPSTLSHVLDIPLGKLIVTESGLFSIFNFNTRFPGFVSWVATSKNLEASTPLETLQGITEEEYDLARGLLEASTQEELEISTILSTTPMETETGWGGKGRVTLIGDAAHALRPASGLGGSLALEDVVVLRQQILKNKKSGGSVPEALRAFETIRFDRCKTIVDDQTRIAEAGYGGKDRNTFEWTTEYEKWVFAGTDADPNPPSNIYKDETINEQVRSTIKRHSKGRGPTASSLLLLVAIIVMKLSTFVSAQQQQNPMTMNGGSLLAMAGNDCVALAVDKRFGSGAQMVAIAPRHVWSPHPNLMVGFVGLEGDVQSFLEDLELEVTSKRNRAIGFGIESKERRVSPPALASITSHLLFGKRGFFVNPIVAGLMENTHKPFLCAMDMIGAQSFSRSFVCCGAASKSIYGTAEALWKPNLEPEKLAEVCGKAFQSALERDCFSGYGILVYLITKDGIVEYDLASRND